MEEHNERREEFKKDMEFFFKEWSYQKGEMFPFDNIVNLQQALIPKLASWGVVFIGVKPFGETLIFAGEWREEGVTIEMNINPVEESNKGEFRTLFRWR